jgi:hypothetical protein
MMEQRSYPGDIARIVYQGTCRVNDAGFVCSESVQESGAMLTKNNPRCMGIFACLLALTCAMLLRWLFERSSCSCSKWRNEWGSCEWAN